MSGLGYTIFEYLVWIAVALAVIIVLFACLAILLAISSSVNPLAAKWKLTTKAKPRHAPQPAPFLSIRSGSHRCPEFISAVKVRGKTYFAKLRLPGSASAPK